MSDQAQPKWPSHSERKQIAHAVRERLVLLFPAAFKTFGVPKPPLMIGVSAEIMLRCPDLTRRDLGAALFDYTTGSTYLRSFVEGAHRIDLEGNPVAEVTPAEIANAQLRLRAGMAAAERASERRATARAHELLRQVKAEKADDADEGRA